MRRKLLTVVGAALMSVASVTVSAAAASTTHTAQPQVHRAHQSQTCGTIWGPASKIVAGRLPGGLTCAKRHPFTVALLGGLNCPYCSSWQKAAEGELKLLGAKVILNLNANGSASTQASQMQEAISRKPDGIVVFPVSEAGIVPSLIAAKSAGIPVEASNSPPAKSAMGDLVGYTGPANTQEGQIGAEILAKAMNKHGDVLVILGAPGTTPEIQRLSGFKSELHKIAPSMKILGTGVGNWEESQSISATSSLLSRFGSKVNGIFGEDDTTAVGAAKAAAAAGFKHLPIVGVGGSTAGLAAIRSGQLYGTMFQSPYLDGAFGPIMLFDQLEHLHHAHVVDLPLPIVTRSNVKSFAPEGW